MTLLYTSYYSQTCYCIPTSSAVFDFLKVRGLALGEEPVPASPNKLTAALTDWKGDLVSISPTSLLGEPPMLRVTIILGEPVGLDVVDLGEPDPFCRLFLNIVSFL